MSLFFVVFVKILIVEDELCLVLVLCDYLVVVGMISEWVDDGGQVIDVFVCYQFDLVLLDLMLLQCDGVDLCCELCVSSDVLVIMVIVWVEEIDCLLGLDIGVDDYICKLFSLCEVVVWVMVVLCCYCLDFVVCVNSGLYIDELVVCVIWNGKGLDLILVEYCLLCILLVILGWIWVCDELFDWLYLDYCVVVDCIVDSYVCNLCCKLVDVGMEGELICLVYGMGYSYEFQLVVLVVGWQLQNFRCVY